MELVEEIEVLNLRLKEFFGIDTSTSQPIWRIVWSEDQYEQRLTDCTPEGFILLTPVMKLLPKYKQWIHEKYILERLVVVPDVNAHEVTTKVSYEPIWVFEDKNGYYLPPKWEAMKFIIDAIYAVQYGPKHNMSRYKDPEGSPEQAKEERRKAVDRIAEELYGNELGQTGLDVMVGQGIYVPSNYEKENK